MPPSLKPCCPPPLRDILSLGGPKRSSKACRCLRHEWRPWGRKTPSGSARTWPEAPAPHVKKSRGIDVDPDEVIILPGAKPAIGYSLMSYVDPGDEVIYPSPGFPIYESWVTYLGGTPKPLVLREENGFAFTPEELEKLVTPKTKVLMLCTPSNPTGGVLSQELLESVAEIVRRKAPPDG